MYIFILNFFDIFKLTFTKQYERLKLDLETTYKYDREKYTAGKTKFIKDIIKEYSLHK